MNAGRMVTILEVILKLECTMDGNLKLSKGVSASVVSRLQVNLY